MSNVKMIVRNEISSQTQSVHDFQEHFRFMKFMARSHINTLAREVLDEAHEQ